MTPEQALDVGKQALILVLILSAPVLLLGLAVGVLISIIQSVTQIQEMTLTFVPKMLAMGVVMLLCLPMIGASLSDFMAQMSNLIVTG